MVDGYTRLQAFCKVVLPQAATGIAATAIFCLIFAWNEYAFAVLLTSRRGADRAALHPDHHRRGRPGLAGGRRRHDAVPGADPGLHRAAAQAPAARHHLRRGAQMSCSRSPRSASRWPRWLRRGPLENVAIGAHRARRLHADAAVRRWRSTPGRSSPRWPARSMFIDRLASFRSERDGRDPRREPAQGLRRLRRGAGLELHRRGRRVLLPARPVGLRQDDDAAHDRRPGAADRRAGSCSAARTSPASAPRERDIAFVFQLFALYPHMNVRRNIAFPLRRAGHAARRDRAPASRRRRASCSIDAPARPARSPGSAGGDRQRVALGRAIVREPQGLPDGRAARRARRRVPRADVRASCARCTTASSATTVYVTHDQIEAMAMADKIAVMNHGVIEQFGAPQEIYDRPATHVRRRLHRLAADELPAASTARCAAGATERRASTAREVAVPALREDGAARRAACSACGPSTSASTTPRRCAAEVLGTEYLGTTPDRHRRRPRDGTIKARRAGRQSRRERGEHVGLAFDARAARRCSTRRPAARVRTAPARREARHG